jgi:hypothetical protein
MDPRKPDLELFQRYAAYTVDAGDDVIHIHFHVWAGGKNWPVAMGFSEFITQDCCIKFR